MCNKVLLALSVFVVSIFASSVDNAAVKIGSELEKAYGNKGKIYVAIADIIVPTKPNAEFGSYLTTSLATVFKDSKLFMIVGQEGVDKEFKKAKILLNKPYDFNILNKISQAIHKTTNIAPQGYLYGQIKDMDKEIQITLKMVDAISGSTIALGTVKFPSDETTDMLLGKQVREIKSGSVSAPIIENKQPETASVSPAKFKVDGFTVELKSAILGSDRMLTLNLLVTNETEDLKRFVLNVGRTFAYDSEGNQYPGEGASIGSASNDRVNDFAANVPSMIPVKATVNFLKVSSKLTTLKAIQLFIFDKEFMLRDIPIARE
jgi:hypothetical protein